MQQLRALSGHVLLGLAVGIGSALLWLNTLRTVPKWAAALVAVAVVFAVELAASAVLRRRAASRPRRRAHARPQPTRKVN